LFGRETGHHNEEDILAKPNYKFQKRQKELAKKKKKEEKRQRKLAKRLEDEQGYAGDGVEDSAGEDAPVEE